MTLAHRLTVIASGSPPKFYDDPDNLTIANRMIYPEYASRANEDALRRFLRDDDDLREKLRSAKCSGKSDTEDERDAATTMLDGMVEHARWLIETYRIVLKMRALGRQPGDAL